MHIIEQQCGNRKGMQIEPNVPGGNQYARHSDPFLSLRPVASPC
jgi:hypothetical protein